MSEYLIYSLPFYPQKRVRIRVVFTAAGGRAARVFEPCFGLEAGRGTGGADSGAAMFDGL